MIKQTLQQDPLKVISEDHALPDVVERTVLMKNKIMLMSNPSEQGYDKLCSAVEAAYAALMADDRQALATMPAHCDIITQSGREVLRAEWIRVKRGD